MNIEPSLYAIESWRYLQEGNENIVFSYIGPSLHHRDFVLRLSKCLPGEARNDHSNEMKATRQKAFYDIVICPLLGKEYLQEKISVPADSDFLSMLNSIALKDRPATRRQKLIDTNVGQMTLCKNLLRISGSCSTFSVEIKPKWGFLPTSQYIEPGSPKLRNCRFCMHQLLKKIEDGKVPSKFCPMLLYAADPHKKYQAIQLLFETPQNNLRCFVDGIETEPASASQKIAEEFSSQEDLLQKMLASVLTQDGVLDRIKRLQRDFDLYDIEGITKILGASVVNEATEQEWDRLIQSYLQAPEQTPVKDLSLLSPAEKVEVIHSYLISATFKDCSIIVSFASNQTRPLANFKQFTLVPELANPGFRHTWTYQLGVVDLDPKPLKKLSRYIKLDQKITQSFLQKI